MLLGLLEEFGEEGPHSFLSSSHNNAISKLNLWNKLILLLDIHLQKYSIHQDFATMFNLPPVS